MNVKGWMIIPLFVLIAGAQNQPGKAPASPAAAPRGAATTPPKLKAIWERVAFNKDIDLNAVTCTAAETCWVVGDKSTIFHTTDGGKTWQVQLGGDPGSTDPDLNKVFSLDAKHGWAMTSGGKILGTTDGGNWVELSTVSGTTNGVWFLSPQVGFEIENPSSTTQSTLRRTDNGGKTWQDLSRCSVDTTVNGLPRKLGCMMEAAQFVSPTVGFMGGEAETGWLCKWPRSARRPTAGKRGRCRQSRRPVGLSLACTFGRKRLALLFSTEVRKSTGPLMQARHGLVP